MLDYEETYIELMAELNQALIDSEKDSFTVKEASDLFNKVISKIFN